MDARPVVMDLSVYTFRVMRAVDAVIPMVLMRRAPFLKDCEDYTTEQNRCQGEIYRFVHLFCKMGPTACFPVPVFRNSWYDEKQQSGKITENAGMTEEMIAKLFETRGLGKVVSPVMPVSGGFMHRMFRAETGENAYAVKHLNPEIMKRPGVMENYRRAEELEQILEDAGIPVVPALMLNGRKMQELDGEYFYIFRWQEGRITDWQNITAGQCREAGNIQGRIHALRPMKKHTEPGISDIDWHAYTEEAACRGSEIAELLQENEPLLYDVQEKLNRARQALPDIECITDEDMDPKNVMWNDGKPMVIDLECLDYGNPVSNALQLSLQWAGITTCMLDTEKMEAFFEGYLEVYDNGFRDYGSVLGLAYTWIEWLEYNITRALGKCQDENERQMGITEAWNTVNRIRYIRESEDRIRQQLNCLSEKK